MMKNTSIPILKITNNPATNAQDACCYGVVFGFSDADNYKNLSSQSYALAPLISWPPAKKSASRTSRAPSCA